MKFWPYLLLAACYRATAMFLGEVPGYIVGGVILAGVAAYWIRRGIRAHRERKQLAEANEWASSGQVQDSHSS